MSTPSAVPEGRSTRQPRELWLSKVNEAHAQYLRADELYRRMVEELSNVADSSNPGFYATVRARQAASSAFAEYQRLTEIYHGLLLTGKVAIPDTDEEPFH